MTRTLSSRHEGDRISVSASVSSLHAAVLNKQQQLTGLVQAGHGHRSQKSTREEEEAVGRDQCSKGTCCGRVQCSALCQRHFAALACTGARALEENPELPETAARSTSSSAEDSTANVRPVEQCTPSLLLDKIHSHSLLVPVIWENASAKISLWYNG